MFHENDLGTGVGHGRCGGRVGVGRNHHLVPRSDAQHPEIEFFGGGGGVEANDPVGPTRQIVIDGKIHPSRLEIRRKASFKKLAPRANGDPSTAKHLADFGNFRFGEICGAKRNSTQDEKLVSRTAEASIAKDQFQYVPAGC